MCEENVKMEEVVETVEAAIEIEPLFEECVDFETFSKSDFRAVKVKECTAVKSTHVDFVNQGLILIEKQK